MVCASTPREVGICKAVPKCGSISRDQSPTLRSQPAGAASPVRLAMALIDNAEPNVVADSAADPSARNPPALDLRAFPRAMAPKTLRKKAGHIDLDDRIMLAKQRAKTAMLLVKTARNEARNEKKRRTRLLRKASTLTSQDLERIAKLKRAGLWDPALAPVVLATEPNLQSDAAALAASSSGSTKSGGSAASCGAVAVADDGASSGTESPAAAAPVEAVDDLMGAGVDDL